MPKFRELFVKTGVFPKDSSKIITTLFDNKQSTDYDFDDDLTEHVARDLITRATEFLQLTKQYFDHLNADSNSPSK